MVRQTRIKPIREQAKVQMSKRVKVQKHHEKAETLDTQGTKTK